MITVALDAMGADGGVAPVVEGAVQLTREDAPIRIVLVGDDADSIKLRRQTGGILTRSAQRAPQIVGHQQPCHRDQQPARP